MHKLLVMTDLHVTLPPETIIGLDPQARLAAGLAHAAKTHPDAERLILTGDLTHHGAAEEYEQLRPLLADLPWPTSLLIGNHDRRAAFTKAFPDAPTDPDGFVQHVVDLDGLRLICLDTLDEDNPTPHRGRLCPARMAWLRAALDQDPAIPTIVFLHHPPFVTGFTGMDDIGLENREELLALLTSRANVKLVIGGHVHRTISASIEGLPMAVFKSPCHQMPMCLFEDGSGHSVDEPGAYGIILAENDRIVVHSEDFTLPEADRFDFETGH